MQHQREPGEMNAQMHGSSPGGVLHRQGRPWYASICACANHFLSFSIALTLQPIDWLIAAAFSMEDLEGPCV